MQAFPSKTVTFFVNSPLNAEQLLMMNNLSFCPFWVFCYESLKIYGEFLIFWSQTILNFKWWER